MKRYVKIALFALLSCAPLGASLEAQIFSFNGHFYQLTATAESWTAAESEAMSLGGHLVTINNSAEQTFITNTFSLNTSNPLWIGFNDAAVEGTFVWASGEPVTFTNWEPGEPNDNGGNEDYATVNWFFARQGGSHDTWNDTPLNGTSGFGGTSDGPYRGIIETVPEPSIFALIGVGAILLFARIRSRIAQG